MPKPKPNGRDVQHLWWVHHTGYGGADHEIIAASSEEKANEVATAYCNAKNRRMFNKVEPFVVADESILEG